MKRLLINIFRDQVWFASTCKRLNLILNWSEIKPRDLEKDALAVVNSEFLPKNYRTTERILNFLHDVSQKAKKI